MWTGRRWIGPRTRFTGSSIREVSGHSIGFMRPYTLRGNRVKIVPDATLHLTSLRPAEGAKMEETQEPSSEQEVPPCPP